jgi:hypothetical protein
MVKADEITKDQAAAMMPAIQNQAGEKGVQKRSTNVILCSREFRPILRRQE